MFIQGLFHSVIHFRSDICGARGFIMLRWRILQSCAPVRRYNTGWPNEAHQAPTLGLPLPMPNTLCGSVGVAPLHVIARDPWWFLLGISSQPH